MEFVANNCESHSHSVRISGVGTLTHMDFNFVQMHDGPSFSLQNAKFESQIKACQNKIFSFVHGSCLYTTSKRIMFFHNMMHSHCFQSVTTP